MVKWMLWVMLSASWSAYALWSSVPFWPLPPMQTVDPNVGMQQLLNSSEDLRGIESEWEKIWSNDQPSHLTPERKQGSSEEKPKG
jgi:hypothetical protein